MVPTLLLSGTSDPFARIDVLEAAMPALVRGQLVTYPRLGHSLRPVLDDALDRIAAFLAQLDAA
jgi:pimeloyl-ACP methyl ester carboxylesterase